MSGNGVFLAGYDVEDKTSCVDFLRRALDAHREFDAPATFFCLGSCVAGEYKAFENAASDPLVDLGQHTWSHVALKSVLIDDGGGELQMVRGGSLDQLEEELERAGQIISDLSGKDCRLLSGPWGYYRGLADRPDILEVVHRSGIRCVRSYCRNERDYFPLGLDVQPFFYGASGFPDVLECAAHGWHDSSLRARLGWGNINAYLDQCRSELEQASSRGLVYGWCAHDWSCLRDDPMLWIVRGLLRHARELGMEILSYSQYWQRQLELQHPATRAA